MPPSAPTPSSSTPTATLPLTPARDVAFTMARLEAIEDATGQTCNQLLIEEFREWVRAGDDAESPEARAKATGRVSARLARRFLSGVLGCTLDEIDTLVGVERVMACMNAAIGPFCKAVIMLNQGTAAAPTEESAKGPTAPAE